MSARPQYDQVSVPLASVRAPAVVASANLSKRYGQGDAQVEALCNVSLEIEEGRLTAIMGPSGSGKSTLMHILAGLDQPSEGSVSIAGVEISSMSDAQLTKLRRQHIGFVFQFFNLLPMLTAENVLMPLRIAGAKPDREWVEELLEAVGTDGRRTHRPSELSGGSAAARLDRPRARDAADRVVRGRADRQARLDHLPRRAGAAAPLGRRARPDDRHGHARPAGGRARRP